MKNKFILIIVHYFVITNDISTLTLIYLRRISKSHDFRFHIIISSLIELYLKSLNILLKKLSSQQSETIKREL